MFDRCYKVFREHLVDVRCSFSVSSNFLVKWANFVICATNPGRYVRVPNAK